MVKPGLSISPGLESIPGRDRQTDGRTDRITVASTRLTLRAVARKMLSLERDLGRLTFQFICDKLTLTLNRLNGC